MKPVDLDELRQYLLTMLDGIESTTDHVSSYTTQAGDARADIFCPAGHVEVSGYPRRDGLIDIRADYGVRFSQAIEGADVGSAAIRSNIRDQLAASLRHLSREALRLAEAIDDEHR